MLCYNRIGYKYRTAGRPIKQWDYSQWEEKENLLCRRPSYATRGKTKFVLWCITVLLSYWFPDEYGYERSDSERERTKEQDTYTDRLHRSSSNQSWLVHRRVAIWEKWQRKRKKERAGHMQRSLASIIVQPIMIGSQASSDMREVTAKEKVRKSRTHTPIACIDHRPTNHDWFTGE